jgi:hypothetical protein
MQPPFGLSKYKTPYPIPLEQKDAYPLTRIVRQQCWTRLVTVSLNSCSRQWWQEETHPQANQLLVGNPFQRGELIPGHLSLRRGRALDVCSLQRPADS